MDSARPSNPIDFLTLKEAADKLAVTVDVLRSWNEHNILKPTITPTGEVGYTQTQIDHFLAIRKNLNQQSSYQSANQQQIPNLNYPTEIKPNSSNDENLKHQQTNNFSQQINNYHFYNQTPSRVAKADNKLTFSFLGIVATFSLLGIASLVVLFSQESKFNSLLGQESIAYDTTNSTLNQTTNINPDDSRKNILKDEGNSVSKNKNSNINKAFETEAGSSSSKKTRDQAALLQSILGKGSDEDIREGVKPDEDIVTYGQTANYGTSSNCPSCTKRTDTQSTVFDTDGNIKVSKTDPSENDLLATTLGVNSFSPAQNLVRQNSSSAALFTFLVLALLAMYALYSNTTRKKFTTLAPVRADGSLLQPINFAPQIAEKERIVEVSQKTDGTVVVIFQGKEYKISKPELDSESDKFIERLMQLSAGIKELEYDSLEDEALILSAPLSKIVTRLGFVGVKRDLFFPRTSKTRVLFRKYITLEDLFAMNLTLDQLSNGFIKNNWL